VSEPLSAVILLSTTSLSRSAIWRARSSHRSPVVPLQVGGQPGPPHGRAAAGESERRGQMPLVHSWSGVLVTTKCSSPQMAQVSSSELKCPQGSISSASTSSPQTAHASLAVRTAYVPTTMPSARIGSGVAAASVRRVRVWSGCTRRTSALIRRRTLSAWSRTWSAPRHRETSGSPPVSGSPSCPVL